MSSCWFSPEGLSLITTHRCTAACGHCCFGCSPSVDRAIPVPRLHALIAETAEVPSIRQVIFTGGECFLLGRHLDALIARCRDLGLATRCVTNGFWAASPAAARARVASLREAGLGELNFSTGSHHDAFVPWECVVWGAAEAVATVPPDLPKVWIHTEGPERILAFVKEQAPAFELPLDSAHICHTCQYLHRSAEALAVLARHGSEVMERILGTYLLACADRALAGASPEAPVHPLNPAGPPVAPEPRPHEVTHARIPS